jgi:hypothetical protein
MILKSIKIQFLLFIKITNMSYPKYPKDEKITYILSQTEGETTKRNERMILLKEFSKEIQRLLLTHSERDKEYIPNPVIKSFMQTPEKLIELLQLAEKISINTK